MSALSEAADLVLLQVDEKHYCLSDCNFEEKVLNCAESFSLAEPIRGAGLNNTHSASEDGFLVDGASVNRTHGEGLQYKSVWLDVGVFLQVLFEVL